MFHRKPTVTSWLRRLRSPRSKARSASKSLFFRSHLARAAPSRPLRPVTMQPRQRAWHRRANRRAPGMPADGGAVRTGCENGPPRCFHTFTHTALSTVALCANSQEGSTPTPRSDKIIIATRVVAVRRCSLARGPQVDSTRGGCVRFLPGVVRALPLRSRPN